MEPVNTIDRSAQFLLWTPLVPGDRGYRRLLLLLSGRKKKFLTYSVTICHVVIMQFIDRGFAFREIPECKNQTLFLFRVYYFCNQHTLSVHAYV